MRLYFLRHTDAVQGADDAARPLSSRGEKQCQALAKFLRRADIEFDAAYSSPLLRARQTVEIVLDASGQGKRVKLEIVNELLNETPQAEFERWLQRLPEADHVLLVGHAPSLAERVRRLLGIARAEALELSKGGLACLKTDDRRTYSLKFLVSPKALGV